MVTVKHWTKSLPPDIQATVASYNAVETVDVMAVLKRARLLRRAVASLSWEEVIASGIGLRNNSFGMEPETALDLMERPEAGLLFVGGFFTDLGVPSLLRNRALTQIEEYRRRIAVTRSLVDAINAGKVKETGWEFIDHSWLLVRAKDRLAEFGPAWALNPEIIDPVIDTAEQMLAARAKLTWQVMGQRRSGAQLH